MEHFRKLGLSEKLLKLLEKAKITLPSEIQEKVIPLVSQGKDVIGGSATGTGKTLAFGVGIIEKTEKDKGVQVLILTPTRELAEQVGNVFIKFSGYKQLKVSIVYGGVNIGHQINSLKNSEIVVGTPGRILDHLERGTINLSNIKTLVLDEADRMLDMGFIYDVEKIIKNCPKKRQTLLFSATISADIEHIAAKHMVNPKFVSVESYVKPEKLKQIYYDVPNNMKFSLLVHLLKQEKSGLVMVFCNTRNNVDFIAENLKHFNIDVLAIHGGLTQKRRNSIMQKFSAENKVYVLVCTDVAARGLDIKGISHIYNYDIPKTDKEYIHRIGRTARAGKEGIAVNILSDRDYENFSNILRDDSLNIENKKLPEIEMVRMNLRKPERVRRQRWDSDDWKGRRTNQKRSMNMGRDRNRGRSEGRDRDRDRGRSGISAIPYGKKTLGKRKSYGGKKPYNSSRKNERDRKSDTSRTRKPSRRR